jgi:predicted Zn-dependent peptidase
MKQAALVFLFLLPLFLTARTAAQGLVLSEVEGPILSEPFPLHRHTLPNGLRVWCQPRPDSESVAALLVIRAGSRYEDLANNGVSHYVEHMLFTGTERWTEEEIKEIIRRRGGRWNGWTGRERTTYFAHVSAQDFDIALDWLAEVVFHPTFPADKVDKERQVIFQERWGRYGWLINTLDALGFGYELDRDVRRALFPDSTLGLRVMGEDASLESLDRAGLLDYYQGHYTPDNAVLIVVGNVTPEQVTERAEVYFGNLEGDGWISPPGTPPLPAEGPHEVVVRGPMPTDQVQLMVGARTVGRTHPDRWALEVLAEILGEDLREEIRYQRGLVYGLGAYNVSFDDTGYFVIYTNSERGHREDILSAVEEHLEKMRRGEVDAERVAEAQAALKGRWALAMEDNVERAMWLAGWSSVLSADEPVPDYQAAIDAVTPEDLSRVVETYFTLQRRYLGLHQPVATVASGARAVGVVVGLGFSAWVVRKLWRRAKAGRKRGG